jgi:hypothetical protein
MGHSVPPPSRYDVFDDEWFVHQECYFHIEDEDGDNIGSGTYHCCREYDPMEWIEWSEPPELKDEVETAVFKHFRREE